MKKLIFLRIAVVVLVIGLACLSFTGCGKAASETAGAASETTAAAAETPAAAGESVVVAGEGQLKDEYRFVMIPILVQAWFDIVRDASIRSADQLGAALGTKITIDYQAPAQADVVQQNTLLEQAIASKPDGIAIDCNDVEASLAIMYEAMDQGIPVVMYVATTPVGETIPYVANDFYEMGTIVANELIDLMGEEFKVAIIGGVPTNSAHSMRWDAQKAVFAQYPGIELVAEAYDYDDVNKAQEEAAKIIAANPDLDAFAVCDAAGPVGVGLAIQEAGKVGEIKYIGIDDVPQLQELMKQGVLDLSVCTRPNLIGEWCTTSLLMMNLGITPVFNFDTGIGYLTPDMLEAGEWPGY